MVCRAQSFRHNVRRSLQCVTASETHMGQARYTKLITLPAVHGSELWPQPDARPIVQPEPSLLGLFLRDFQPLLPPDPFDPLMVHMPAAVVQHPGNHPISIAPKLSRQLNDVIGKLFFVRQATGYLALRGTMLTDGAAGTALRYGQEPAAHDRCTGGGGRGLEVSPGGLGQDHLVQRQIRYGMPEPGVLGLQLLQPFELIMAYATKFVAPSRIGLLRHNDLSDRVCDRLALTLQHFNLPQLQNDLFGFVSLSSHLLVPLI